MSFASTGCSAFRIDHALDHARIQKRNDDPGLLTSLSSRIRSPPNRLELTQKWTLVTAPDGAVRYVNLSHARACLGGRALGPPAGPRPLPPSPAGRRGSHGVSLKTVTTVTQARLGPRTSVHKEPLLQAVQGVSLCLLLKTEPSRESIRPGTLPSARPREAQRWRILRKNASVHRPAARRRTGACHFSVRLPSGARVAEEHEVRVAQLYCFLGPLRHVRRGGSAELVGPFVAQCDDFDGANARFWRRAEMAAPTQLRPSIPSRRRPPARCSRRCRCPCPGSPSNEHPDR